MGLLKDIEKEANAKKPQTKKIKLEDIRYCIKSLELLVEATALAIVSGFAIYSGVQGDLPDWGRVIVVGAGSLIALRAFVEFVKFLNRRA